MDMIELTDKGDHTIEYDEDDPDEVAVAKAAFETYRAKGRHIFYVDDDGAKSTRKMETFDPKAGLFIAIKQLRGG